MKLLAYQSSSVSFFFFTGEQLPQIVQETISSKEQVYLDTLARIQKERKLLARPAPAPSRKVTEPTLQREAKPESKSSGRSCHTKGILFLHEHGLEIYVVTKIEI